MLTDVFKNSLSSAFAAITATPNDPLFKEMEMPANSTPYLYQSLFLSMTYFLKFKVKQAKENDFKKFGVYVKSLDQFVIGAYITVIDNDGEDSVVLDFTYEEDKMKDIIDAGFAVCVDDPAFTPYSSGATNSTYGADGEYLSFYIVPDYIHTVYCLCGMVLKNHIESLLDDPNADPTVTFEGLFTATGFLDDDGNKKVSIDVDETLKQMIKNDDANAVDALDVAIKAA